MELNALRWRAWAGSLAGRYRRRTLYGRHPGFSFVRRGGMRLIRVLRPVRRTVVHTPAGPGMPIRPVRTAFCGATVQRVAGSVDVRAPAAPLNRTHQIYRNHRVNQMNGTDREPAPRFPGGPTGLPPQAALPVPLRSHVSRARTTIVPTSTSTPDSTPTPTSIVMLIPGVRATPAPPPAPLRTSRPPVVSPRLRVEEPPHRWAQAQFPSSEHSGPGPAPVRPPLVFVPARQARATASAQDPHPPGAPSSPPAPQAPNPRQPSINLDQLTDDVVRRIDRRITAHRERLGRI